MTEEKKIKQRMRKKVLYRQVQSGARAKVLSIMKTIAATLPAPPIDPDEYHEITGDAPSVWSTGHARAISN